MIKKMKTGLPAAVASVIMIILSLAGADMSMSKTALPDDLSALSDSQITRNGPETEAAADTYASARLLMAAFGIIALISGGISAFLVTRIITRPVDLPKGRTSRHQKTKTKDAGLPESGH
jgi:hypothetical protein